MSMINEFVEKLIDRLEELRKAESDREDYSDNHDYYDDWKYAFEDGASDGRHYAYVKSIKIIKELAEEYKDVPDTNVGKWIPVSEALPDEEGSYLVTFNDGYVSSAPFYDEDWELWCDSGEPVAWQPLPQPYKG